MTVVGMLGSEYYAPSAKIILADEIYPEVHSAARDAGMLTGDIIKTINGNRVNDFSDIFSAALPPNNAINFSSISVFEI